jgi:hypothetical protein
LRPKYFEIYITYVPQQHKIALKQTAKIMEVVQKEISKVLFHLHFFFSESTCKYIFLGRPLVPPETPGPAAFAALATPSYATGLALNDLYGHSTIETMPDALAIFFKSLL